MACDGRASGSLADMEHGVDIGDHIGPLPVQCTGDFETVVGANDDGPQLITLATPNDCALCERHLAGLLDASDDLPDGMMSLVVTWAPVRGRRSSELFADYPRVRECSDAEGILWE